MARINSGVECNGEAIVTRRKEKGWTREDLAHKSGVSVRTIASMEGGKRVTLYTLGCVAKALETDHQKFAADIQTVESDKPRLSLRLTVNLDFYQTDESELLQEVQQAIQRMFNTSGNIAFEAYRPSSIVIELSCDEELAQQILANPLIYAALIDDEIDLDATSQSHIDTKPINDTNDGWEPIDVNDNTEAREIELNDDFKLPDDR